MKLFLCIVFTLNLTWIYSQDFLSWKYRDRYFSFSLGTGATTYIGELNYKSKLNRRLSLVSVGVEARLFSRIGARIEGSYFKFEGSDANAPNGSFQRQRNLSFKSKNTQFSLAGLYYIKPYAGSFHDRWIFDPYLTLGIGYMYYKPTAELGGVTYSLRDAKTEGVNYKKWTVTIPFGIGAKFVIKKYVNLNFEILYHLTRSDYLDDVSKTYGSDFATPTAKLLSDRKDEIGVIDPTIYGQIESGAKRGDEIQHDRFIVIGVKIEFFIPPDFFRSKIKS